jgi:hypothetical protein
MSRDGADRPTGGEADRIDVTKRVESNSPELRERAYVARASAVEDDAIDA